jgi:hypothetical protein
MTDDENRYEDLRHFITNSGTPARGGRCLLSFEKAMKETDPPEDDREATYRRYAASQYQAVMNPCPLATEEQVDYCLRAKEEMEKWRAMYDAGWKTPTEEGYDAFDPKARPVDWDGEANPYPAGTPDHDEWDDGYSNAIMSASPESDDAYQALEEESDAEAERQARESSLESFAAYTEWLARSRDSTFLALTDINCRLFMLASFLMVFEFEVGQYLPDDVHERLTEVINRISSESGNREVERIGPVEGRLQDFGQLVMDVKLLGTEIAARNITTPHGVIGDDLYHFWHVFEDRRYREHNQAKNPGRGSDRGKGERKG